MVVAMRREIARYTDGKPETVIDELVAEAPVEFRLGDVPIAVLMRTPGNDEELGLGFAITEGIVLGPDEVGGVHVRSGSDGDRYDIHLADGVIVDPEQFRRSYLHTPIYAASNILLRESLCSPTLSCFFLSLT